MNLKIAFSPCPNDTFIFYAAVHKKIDTEGIDFELYLADVEELNKDALKAKADISKLSYHAYLYVSEDYQLLRAGSALGENNGPLLIAKNPDGHLPLSEARIAVPGDKTTANLLLHIAHPEAKNRISYLFSDIEKAVLTGRVDYGLIIHESRFTYREKNLHKILDLGEFWEIKTALPVPLGGIVIRRDFEQELKQKINRIIRRSMQYAYEKPDAPLEFMRTHAQEMDPGVMRKHIELYVNDFSFDVGKIGEAAVERLFSEARKIGLGPKPQAPFFIAAE